MRESSIPAALVVLFSPLDYKDSLGSEALWWNQVHHSCDPHAAIGGTGDHVPECESLLLLGGGYPEPVGLQGCHHVPYCYKELAQEDGGKTIYHS